MELLTRRDKINRIKLIDKINAVKFLRKQTYKYKDHPCTKNADVTPPHIYLKEYYNVIQSMMANGDINFIHNIDLTHTPTGVIKYHPNFDEDWLKNKILGKTCWEHSRDTLNKYSGAYTVIISASAFLVSIIALIIAVCD